MPRSGRGAVKLAASLKSRLLLLVVAAIVPLLLNSLYSYQQGRDAAQAAIEQDIRVQLRSALVPEAIVLDNVHQVLRIMANANEMKSPKPSDCNGLATRLLETQINFANFGAATRDGKVVCSGKSVASGVSLADRRWFKEARERNDFSDGELVSGRISGERVIAFGNPLAATNDGPLLFASLRLDWLVHVVKDTPVREGWTMAAYTIDGHTIALQPDTGNQSAQASAEGELLSFIQTRPPETVRTLVGPDGVRRLYGMAPLKIAHGDIYMVIGAPPDVAFSEVEGQFRRALLMSILVAAVSFALAWMVIQRQFFDFSDALRAAFDGLSKGDRSVRAPVSSAISEFQVITDGFNRMAGELDALEQRHASDQQRVRESTALLDAVMNSSEALVYIFDLEGRCLLANQAFACVLGTSPESMLGVSRDTLVSSEHARALRADDRRVLDGGTSIRVEESFHAVDNGERNFLSVKFPLRNTSGNIYAVGGISSDITEKIRSEIALSLAAMVFEASAEGIFITDRDQRILQVNPRFTAITGYTAAEAIGQTPRLLRSGVQDRDFYLHLWARLQRTGAWEGEITNRRKDGSLYAEWLSISTVKTANGTVQNYIGLFSDLTQKQALDRRVDELQNFDPLTGLPNRNLFIDRVQHSVRTASREKRGMAVFWVDIARFRVINDTFGHPIGDSVLTEVGQRLQHVVRAADSITRLSADEFGVLMFGFDDENDIVVLAQRVIEAIGQPMQIGEHQFSLASHLGISVFPKDGETAADLLKAADTALLRAKQAGRDIFRFFTAGMDVDAARRLTVEAELRNALAANQFEMHYQPQINLATGRLCGTEALIRWTHPVLGAISPTEFIPLAEEAQLIGPIGEWAMRVSCRQNKAWLDAGFQPLPVAVNVSGRQFHQPDLVEMIAGILAETALPHHLLEIELTETAFIGDMMAAVAIAHRIKGLGVLLALDDFGTGYSSLSYLSGLPFDKIKIDQSFVRDITTNPVNAAIATATIAMGRSLDLIVLAEGVEHPAQMHFLRNRQCEAIQGYLFSKPLRGEDLTALLISGRTLSVGSNVKPPAQTILLVDDEVNIVATLKRLLRRDGYEILTATNAHDAMNLLAEHEVQVILSDQRMPEMTGVDFLAKTKQMYPNAVRMILSGYSDVESITSAINRGAIYRFLSKPWDNDELRAAVREAFRVAEGRAHP